MKTGTRIGIITGTILSIYFFAIRYFNLTQHKFAFFGIFLIIVLGTITSCLLFDKETNFIANFGKIFMSGFSTTTTATFLTTAAILCSYVIIPSLKQTELQELQTKLSADTSIPDNQKKEYYDSQANHFYSLKSSQYLFPLLMSGAIFSALASIAISGKNKQNRRREISG
jgi:hypothetical protein